MVEAFVFGMEEVFDFETEAEMKLELKLVFQIPASIQSFARPRGWVSRRITLITDEISGRLCLPALAQHVY